MVIIQKNKIKLFHGKRNAKKQFYGRIRLNASIFYKVIPFETTDKPLDPLLTAPRTPIRWPVIIPPSEVEPDGDTIWSPLQG